MGAGNQVNDQPVVLFDGVCNLCNSSVNFVIDRDRGFFQFASLQSEAAKALLEPTSINPERLDSIVLVEDGKVYHKSTAALKIASKLSGLWPLLSVFRILPVGFRDFFYDLIARNRYRWFGKQDACRIPTPELKDRFLDS
ncbi:thiol-disulfide oxidoreductase DCC family protein [Marinoscillum pacificum]|uniref:thiol-disulfide oxidoreductase DCC family protein n=1 Tax=Marinoscillum pacificum TaxID=392723 RepID=UPI0021585E2B|nr:thiol-disulfide oxidoreductase DCC family protein [Marinoscillum pacificum]